MAATCLVQFALIAFSFVAVSDGSCTSILDCGNNQVCCKKECVDASNCIGHDCKVNSDCSSSGDETCCKSGCEYGSDCIGHPCDVDSDCANWVDRCCHGTCQKDDDHCYAYDPSIVAVAFGSVITSLLVICLIVGTFFACRHRRTANHGSVIAGTESATQANPLYPGQGTQSYQQGYPPHNPVGTMEATQQPPSDTGAPLGRSRGVYAPKPSYGAVPSD